MDNQKQTFFKTGNVSKKVVIIIVLVIFVFSVSLATFAQPLARNILNLNSNGNIGSGSTLDWDVSFTGVVQSSLVGQAKEISEVRYDHGYATFSVLLTNPGDSITYDFTVENRGILNAKVESIYMLPVKDEKDIILFTTSGLNVGDSIKVGEKKTFKVTTTYNPSYQGGNVAKRNVTILVNFEQA